MPTLWNHQQEAVDFASRRAASMLEMGMGTGKTAVAIKLLESSDWRVSDRPPRALIVCPVAVVPAWRKQFLIHAERLWVLLEVGETMRHTRLAQGREVANVEATHNNTMQARIAAVGRLAGQFQTLVGLGYGAAVVTNYETAREPRFVEAFSGKFDVVIADESQRMKNHRSATFKGMKRLGMLAKRRLCLSGTPRPHSPADVWAQYNFLDPTLLEKSFLMFRSRYAVLARLAFAGRRPVEVVRSWRDLDGLGARLSPATYVCGRDVLSLPESVDVDVSVEMPKETRRVYARLEAGLCADLQAGTVTPQLAIVRLLRLQQVTSGYVAVDRTGEEPDSAPVLQELDDAKQRALLDIVEDLPPGAPFVVFCRFRHDIAKLRAALELHGGAAELSGKANELSAWQAGEKRAILVQIQSGGVGIDLTRACYCFYFSLGFSLGDYEQSRARVHRPGQTNKVTYFHMLATGTVDETVYSALEDRQEVVGKVLAALVRIQKADRS